MPKVYWNIPRPNAKTGATPVIFCHLFWSLLKSDPSGLFIWSYRSVSPNEITGTNGVLEKFIVVRVIKSYNFIMKYFLGNYCFCQENYEIYLSVLTIAVNGYQEINAYI